MNRFLICILVLSILPLVTGQEIIDGNSVYIDDDRVFINVTPHTIVDSDSIYIDVLSKVYTGNVSVIFGVNKSKIVPTSVEYYNPHNVSIERSYTCNYEFNYTTLPKYFWCYVYNSTTGQNVTLFEHSYETGYPGIKTAVWYDTEFREYSAINRDHIGFSHNFDNMTDWYILEDLPIVQDVPRKMKINVYVPPLPVNSTSKSYSAKYDWGIMPSSYESSASGILAAYQNDHLYYIDPFINGTTGLVAYYYLNGTTEDVHNGRNLTASGGANFTTSEGVLGYAAHFDGLNDLMYGNPYNESTSSWSWSFWVKAKDGADGGSENPIAYQVDSNDWVVNVLYRSDRVNNLQYAPQNYFDVPNTFALLYPTNAVNLSDGWRHIVLTGNGTYAKMYFNGTLQSNPSDDHSYTGQVINYEADAFALGGTTFGTGTNYFDGYIHDVALYDRELTSDEVTTLYNSGTPLGYNEFGGPEPDSTYFYVNYTGSTPTNNTIISTSSYTIESHIVTNSTNTVSSLMPDNRGSLRGYWRLDGDTLDDSTYGNNPISNGTITKVTNCPIGDCYDFDDDASGIYIPDSDSLEMNTEFTITFRAKQDEYVSGAGIVGKYVGPSDRSYAIRTVNTNEFGVYLSETGSSLTSTPTTQTDCGINESGVWHSYAITYSGTDLLVNFYRDGEFCEQRGTSADFLYNGSANFTIGWQEFDPVYFNGSLDDVSIHDRVLGTEEIRAIHNATANNYTADFSGLTNNTEVVFITHIGDSENYTNTSRLNFTFQYSPQSSDPLGLADASTILFVDKNNPGCNDGTRAAALDPTTPFCTINYAVDTMISGDTVYVQNGTYNEYITLVDRNFTSTSGLYEYPGSVVNLSYVYTDFLSAPNSLWLNISENSSVNHWRTNTPITIDTVTTLYLANGTKFFMYGSSYYDEFNVNTTTYPQYNYSAYSNDTGDVVHIKTYDLSFNPNNHAMYLSQRRIGIINMDNVSGDFTIGNFTFLYSRYGIYGSAVNNVSVKENIFYGGQAGVKYASSSTTNTSYTNIQNNTFIDYIDKNWIWADMKVEAASMENSGIYLQRVDFNNTIDNNIVKDWFNGILVQSDNSSGSGPNINTVISGNYCDGIYDDCYESEYMQSNQLWYNNTINNSFVGFSIAPGLETTTGTTSVALRNYCVNALRHRETSSSWFEGECLKIGNGAYNTTNWTLAHNTFDSGNKAIYNVYQYRSTKGVIFVNNIMEADTEVIYRSGLASDDNHYDYNIYYSTFNLFRYWNSMTDNSYSTLSAALASADDPGTWDLNSYDSDPILLAGGIINTSSPAYNTGVNIETTYGINDPVEYYGQPDIGMYEVPVLVNVTCSYTSNTTIDGTALDCSNQSLIVGQDVILQLINGAKINTSQAIYRQGSKVIFKPNTSIRIIGTP